MNSVTTVAFKHILRTTDVRHCCVDNDWYTAGTVEEYNRMFEKLIDANKYGIDANDVRDIALDIWAHSDLENIEWGKTLDEVVDTLAMKIETSVVERNIR